MLDNWEDVVFIAALSWSSMIVYWMIDIITTAAMGEHVSFVDRIVIIFISLPKFVLSSLWFTVKLMLVIFLTWRLAIVWNGRWWFCECRWAYVGIHFCSKMHFLIQSCFGSSSPILLLLSCCISGVADGIYFSIFFSALPWWLWQLVTGFIYSCRQSSKNKNDILCNQKWKYTHKWTLTRNGNTLINELCKLKYCLPISDLL
jgi:hypothetical protein